MEKVSTCLLVKLGRKLHGLHELELLVGEAPVLVGRGAFEEPCICAPR